MKFLLGLFILTSGLSIAQSTIYWEPEITVADGASFGNIRPRLTLAANDVPVVIMGKGTQGYLFSSRWNGAGFDTPITLLPNGMGSYLATWTGPDIASKGDTVIVVFKAAPMETGHVYSVRSTDGGLTYSDTIRVDNHPVGVAWLPSLDIDENGNPSVVYMAHDVDWIHPRYFVNHSTDNGLTYQGEMDIAVTIPDEACDCCPAEYVIDGNRHALLYRNNETNLRDIYGLFSNDDGLTYPSFDNVEQLDWYVTSCPSTGPHGMFRTGELLSVSSSRASGNYRVYISRSTTTTNLTFNNSIMMTPPVNSSGVQNYPRISGIEDSIFVVWQESEGSSHDIMCSFTTDGDLTKLLTNKHTVNTNLSGSQMNPDVKYSNGFVHLVYQDATSGDVIYRRGIVGTLGIENDKRLITSIYPNPSNNGVFTIHSQKTINTFNVIDQNGKSVSYELRYDNGVYTLILKNASNGNYVLTCSDGKQNFSYQLVIK
jgi:hypothetical protein